MLPLSALAERSFDGSNYLGPIDGRLTILIGGPIQDLDGRSGKGRKG
jgi:hypothetical protein